MAGSTTAMCTSFKTDMLSGLHCFNATVTPTATTSNAATQITSVSSLVGLSIGMALTGTGVSASTVIASIDSSTTLTMSKAATASNSGTTITATGDTYKMALIKVSPTGTYGAATTNYTDLTGNSDEVTGTNYVAGGTALTNVSPTNPSGVTAIINFSPSPSWTSASFSATAAIIYDLGNVVSGSPPTGTTSRRGPIATRSVSVHDFSGTQTVTAGTFTAVMPGAAAGTAILNIA